MILEHSKAPRNYREAANANQKAEGYNPLCGDRCTVYLEVEGDAISDIGFQGSGCAISQGVGVDDDAELKGKTREEAEELFEQFHHLVTGDEDAVAMRTTGQAGGVFRRFEVSRAGEMRNAGLAHAAVGARRQARNPFRRSNAARFHDKP